MSKNEIKAIASPMTGCPAWTIAVFKAEDVPEGTEVFPAAPAAQGDAKETILVDTLQKAIGWCEDPGFRTTHTAKQMQTLLDGMRKEFIAAIGDKAAS